ncbi:hypothetical protein BME96_19080 (plasmid) [Virgibacillus halodenitrificans]|uniref:Uncharacterized protein n=1 Tax=Virgibacillus halodenitrificans TaxID=1482 RepID=A0AAC9J396_VIRHA|nr:hypothetical protein [Virgibacillus halodenitrificans]APC50387.1 hypothetical protein BME96_19080 [Virgibacillus halodenitrificans]CDQ37703.1 hypothetical protein BN993_07265 [Virgibacillus halodenitrificans]
MRVVNQGEKKNKFIRVFAEKNLYPILEEMGNTKKMIDKYQKKRIKQSILLGTFLLFLGLFISSYFYIAALILSFAFYKYKYKSIISQYTGWKFQRHLQFSKFTRLLIPYLKQNKGETSLYSIFNKILQRTENQEDKNSLYKLMTEMSNKPNDIQPFIDYANRSSGTDMSVLFMSTIFDYQQSSFDTSVIDELGKIASKELIHGIDEIINFKLRRFVFFPTKVVMSSFVIVLGFAIAVLLANLPDMQF